MGRTTTHRPRKMDDPTTDYLKAEAFYATLDLCKRLLIEVRLADAGLADLFDAAVGTADRRGGKVFGAGQVSRGRRGRPSSGDFAVGRAALALGARAENLGG